MSNDRSSCNKQTIFPKGWMHQVDVNRETGLLTPFPYHSFYFSIFHSLPILSSSDPLSAFFRLCDTLCRRFLLLTFTAAKGCRIYKCDPPKNGGAPTRFIDEPVENTLRSYAALDINAFFCINTGVRVKIGGSRWRRNSAPHFRAGKADGFSWCFTDRPSPLPI